MDLTEIFEDFISTSSASPAAAAAADANANANANADPLTNSNDNEDLLGSPREQIFDNGIDATPSASSFSIGALLDMVEEELGEYEVRDDGNDAGAGADDGEVDGPCSNDNPLWDEDTQPCPNAIDVFGDLATTTTTVAPVGDGISSSEFGSGENAGGNGAPGEEQGEDNAANEEDVLDGGEGVDILDLGGTSSSPTKGPTDSPSKGPTASPSKSPTTALPTKQPSISPSRQPIALSPAWDSTSTETIPDGDTPIDASESPESGSVETTTPEDDGTPVVVVANDDSDVDYVSYPSFYSCSASCEEELVQANGNGNGNEELPLRFNYEIYTSASVDDDDVSDVLATFERQLANGVASSLGLLDCPGAVGGVPVVEVAVRSGGDSGLLPGGGRRRTLHKAEIGGKNRMLGGTDVVGVSMDPTDEADTEISACASSATLDTPSQCSPIIGAMTAWITEAQRRRLRQLVDSDSKEEQEAMLYDLVESYIEENEESYLNDELLHVAYTGRRSNAIEGGNTIVGANPDQIDGATTTVPINSGGEDAGPNVVAISLAVVAVLIAVIVLASAMVFRRRRQRRHEEAGLDLDLETGAFPGLTPESESNRYTETGAFPTLTPGSESNRYNREDDETEASVPLQDPNMRSADLFGLEGVAPSDALSPRGADGSIVPPSSLAALGAASTLVARQISYTPPGSPPQDSSSEQQDTSDISSSVQQDTSADTQQQLDLDLAPTIEEASEDDILPMSPVNADDNASDLSSTFGDDEEDESDQALASGASPSVTNILANVGAEVFDQGTPASPADDDEPEDSSSGVMV